VPHPADFVVEAGKAYYLLPKRWGEDAGYTYTMVGSVVVPQRSSVAHSTFSVHAAAASAPPPAEFDKLSYAKLTPLSACYRAYTYRCGKLSPKLFRAY
jgi:hypothetical protein